jgi:hypothetical protein
LFVDVKMNGASGQWSRAACRRLSVPTALIEKSVCGSRAAQSCEGWAAQWITSDGLVTREGTLDPVPVADVEVQRGETLHGGVQLRGHAGGGRLGTEEVRPHVVVDSDDVEPLLGEVADRFGADEAA